MAQFTWPIVNVSAANPSVGATGTTIPADATYVGGLNGGNLVGIKVESDGTVDVSATGLPASLGQKTMANSTSVAIASDQSSVPVLLQAGSALAGKFGVDQTTPGTTNAVSLAQVGSTTVATGNGVVSAGVQRVAIASDNTAFSVNATLQAGSQIIGKISIDQTTPGTTNAVSVSQIGANTVSTGNGVVGTGVQRVAIASDNTAFSVNAVQSGTWTVQPGNTPNTSAWLVTEVPPSGATNANSSLASTALEASHVIKASAGRLYQLTGVNTKTSAQYIQVFNSTTVPADTTAPILLAYVGAGANFSWDFGQVGRYFSTGISVSNSSTAATKTIGSADCWFNAEFV